MLGLPCEKKTNNDDFKKLDWMNLIAGILHLGLTLFVIIYASVKEPGEGEDPFNFDVNLIADTFVPQETLRDSLQSYETIDGLKFNVLALIIVFLVVTWGAHFAYRFLCRKFYRTEIDSCRNSLRWIEYGISASIMLVILTILSGVRNLHVLALVFFATVGQMYMGYVIEQNLDNPNKLTIYSALVIGWLLLLAAWFPLIWNFFTVIAKAEEFVEDMTEEEREEAGAPPTDLKFLIWVIFGFFSSFGVWNLLHALYFYPRLQRKRGNDYKAQKRKLGIFIEQGYIVLSFVSKLILVLWVTSTALFSGLRWLRYPGHADG